MEINLWVLGAAILRVLTVILAIILIPIQYKELKKPTDDWRLRALRHLLIMSSYVYIAASIIPFAHNTQRLDTASELTLQNIATFSATLAVSSLFALLFSMYVIVTSKKKK